MIWNHVAVLWCRDFPRNFSYGCHNHAWCMNMWTTKDVDCHACKREPIILTSSTETLHTFSHMRRVPTLIARSNYINISSLEIRNVPVIYRRCWCRQRDPRHQRIGHFCHCADIAVRRGTKEKNQVSIITWTFAGRFWWWTLELSTKSGYKDQLNTHQAD